MGLATVVQFLRSVRDSLKVPEVQVQPTADGLPITAEHYAPTGVDAVPLEGDTAVTAPGTGNGRWVVMGYMDTKNAGTAGPGEFRIYSRNSDGAIQATIWLKSDGSVVTNGVMTVDANGNMVIGSSADSLALASRVSQLETHYILHTHPVVLTPSPLAQASTPPLTPINYASARVKVDS